MMRQFGIIGKKLDHSFSPRYFNSKFQKEGIEDAIYRLFPLEDIAFFPKLLMTESNLSGLSVTIPYKESVIPFLDELAESAAAVEAVNCIEFLPNARLRGHNTDVIGFGDSLMPLLEGRTIEKALVLGSGGAAKAVCFVLKNLGINPIIVSRNATSNQINYKDLDKNIISEHKLIVNCSPLGTFPQIDSFPDIPYPFLDESHILYDLVYNPEETCFMKKGKEQGALVTNGLEMLHQQAEAAWKIWSKS